LDGVILLSEVNPNTSASLSIKKQVKDWYGIDIRKGTYLEMVLELNEYCQQNQKILVIRDFSFADFTPHVLNNFEPEYEFSSVKILEGVIPLTIISFVRDAYDVWISRNCPPNFSTGYLKFAKKLVALKAPIFKYENFCDFPEMELAKMCKTMGITYEKAALEKPNSYKNITGDNQIKKVSRGRKLNNIARLKRKQIPQKLLAIGKADTLLQKANLALNYPKNFSDEEMDTKYPNWIIAIKWSWFRYRNPSHFHTY
tara:strand:- start:13976 stop:14743 length:768 start_codon:yes stop_codon:yes gene_type:complete